MSNGPKERISLQEYGAKVPNGKKTKVCRKKKEAVGGGCNYHQVGFARYTQKAKGDCGEIPKFEMKSGTENSQEGSYTTEGENVDGDAIRTKA